MNRLREWASDQGLSVVVITVLTVLFSVVLAEFQTKFGYPTMIVSLLTVLILYSLTSFLAFHSIGRRISGDVRETLAVIEARQAPVPEALSWLIATEQLVAFESQTKAREIWLISPDLSEDIIDAPFSRVVRENLARGIEYHFFIPDTAVMRSRAEQLRRRHNQSMLVHVSFLSDEFFFLVQDFDFVIYNPYAVDAGGPRIAYMGLPLSATDGRWQARVGDNLIDALIGQLSRADARRPHGAQRAGIVVEGS